MLDRCRHPHGQAVLDTEHRLPFVLPDSSQQRRNRLSGKIGAQPFESPDDITSNAVAQHQHSRWSMADFDDLLAEIERPRPAVG